MGKKILFATLFFAACGTTEFSQQADDNPNHTFAVRNCSAFWTPGCQPIHVATASNIANTGRGKLHMAIAEANGRELYYGAMATYVEDQRFQRDAWRGNGKGGDEIKKEVRAEVADAIEAAGKKMAEAEAAAAPAAPASAPAGTSNVAPQPSTTNPPPAATAAPAPAPTPPVTTEAPAKGKKGKKGKKTETLALTDDQIRAQQLQELMSAPSPAPAPSTAATPSSVSACGNPKEMVRSGVAKSNADLIAALHCAAQVYPIKAGELNALASVLAKEKPERFAVLQPQISDAIQSL